MKTVILEELVLAGFGRYTGEVQVHLEPGLTNLVADNEQGKSTLVAGLMAVLFGLPTRDGSGFTQERYRNWSGPPRFAGSVTLRVDGVRYRVERQFERNEVAVYQEEAGGMRQVLRTVHNPLARRSDKQYETWLREHLGLGSRDLFAATFCLTQPLPEADQLDAQVQQLLAGAGAGSFEAALGLLAEWSKQVTRRTGDLGLTPRNGHKDQELEQIEVAIADLEAAIQGSTGALDHLEAVGRELQAVQQRAQEAREQRDHQAALLEAWRQWLELADERRRALRRAAELQETLQAGQQLMAQIQSREAELQAQYPEWLHQPPERGEQLVQLVRTHGERARLAQDLERLAARSREGEERIAAAQRRLAEEYPDVAGRPDLPAQHRQLVERRQQATDLSRRLQTLAQERERLRQQLQALRPWDRLGQAPVKALNQLRSLGREAYRVRENLEQMRRTLRQSQEELQNRCGLLERATPAERERFRNYPTQRMQLQMELQKAGAAVQAAEEQLRILEAARAAYASQYGDLEPLTSDAGAAVARKIDLLTREQQLRQDLERAREAVAADRERLARFKALASASAGLAAAATVTWFLTDQLGLDTEEAAAFGLFAGGLAGTAAWNMVERYGRDEAAAQRAETAQQALDDLLAEGAAVDQQLGPFAGADFAALGELRQRLQDRQEARRRLEELAATAPRPAAVREQRAQLEAARDALERLEREAAAAQEQYGAAPDALHARWQELRRTVTETERRVLELTQAEFGTEPEAVPALPVTALEGKWRELAELAAIAGAEPATAGDLLQWLAGLDGSHWAAWAEEAGAWESLTRQLAEIHGEERHLTEPGPDGRTRLERLEAEVAELTAAVHPFTAETDPAQVAARVQAAQQLEQTIAAETAALKTLAQQREEKAGEIAALDQALEQQRRQLAAVLAPAGDDIAVAHRRWEAFAAGRDELTRWQERLQVLLEARGAQSLEQLAERRDEAQADAFGARRQQQELRRRFPALPDPAEEQDPVRLQETQRELESQLATLEQELQAAQDMVVDLRGRQAELQGREVINVAAAELELQELKARRAELLRKRDALALAHRELRAAVESYQTSHRDRLAQSATAYFQAITGVAGRRVAVDPAFRIAVYEADGRPVEPAQLSQGARDQLYFALRLAIADLMAAAVQLPLILDDPFVNADRRRLERIRSALDQVSAGRQVLILSHDPTYRQWGEPAAVARVGRPQGGDES